MTALHLACSHGNYEVMKLLVGAFADVNATTDVSRVGVHVQQLQLGCVFPPQEPAFYMLQMNF